LEVAQQLLVDVAEQVAVLRFIEINAFVQLVDDLAQERAGLHVVVGILERAAKELMSGRAAFQFFQAGKQVVVDEFHQPVAVMPSASAAQLTQRSFCGSGER